MKRIINKIGLFVSFAVVMFCASSCEDNVPDRTPSPEVFAGYQGMYFDVKQALNSFDLELTDPKQVEIIIKRLKTEEAGTASVVVTANDENVFSIPQSVSFAAGQESTVLTITFPNADAGIPYSAAFHLEGENVNAEYLAVPKVTIVVTRIDYEPIPNVIYVDGVIAGIYGAPATPMYATAVMASYPSGKQTLRLTNVYNREAANQDDNGILDGFAYTAQEEIIGDRSMFIDIIDDNATMQVLGMGIDWGDGELITGSINPYISTNASYPPGKVVRSDDGDIQYIEFGASSLFYQDGGYGPAPVPASTYIYFSLEAFWGE